MTYKKQYIRGLFVCNLLNLSPTSSSILLFVLILDGFRELYVLVLGATTTQTSWKNNRHCKCLCNYLTMFTKHHDCRDVHYLAKTVGPNQTAKQVLFRTPVSSTCGALSLRQIVGRGYGVFKESFTESFHLISWTFVDSFILFKTSTSNNSTDIDFFVEWV